VLRGHTQRVRSIVFSPAGDLLATASEDGSARLWSAAQGKELAVLRGHEAGVWDVSFSPDGKWLLTAGEDYTAVLHPATRDGFRQFACRVLRNLGPSREMSAAQQIDLLRSCTQEPATSTGN